MEKVSICITHYNRPHHLIECTKRINDKIRKNWENIEIVVSDDGSDKEFLKLAKKAEVDVFLEGNHVGGGSNLNRSIKASTGDYIIYNQDDFYIEKYDDFIPKCIKEFNNNDEIMFIRLYGFIHQIIGLFSDDIISYSNVIDKDIFFKNMPLKMGEYNESFCEIYRDFFALGQNKWDQVDIYSDNPHIRPRYSFDKLGFYKEGSSMSISEGNYAMRFFESNYRCLFYGNLYRHQFGDSTNVMKTKEEIEAENNHQLENLSNIYRLVKKYSDYKG